MTGHSAYILSHLEAGKGITQMEAYELFGCARLGARIYDLRQAGYPIVSERETGVNRDGTKISWTRYRMGVRA